MSADLVVTKQLVNQLGSPLESQRLEAERILDSLGPVGLEALLKVIASEEQKRRKIRRRIIGAYICVFAVIVLASLYQWVATGLFPNPLSNAWYLCYGLIALSAFSTTQRNATVALNRYDDIRAVGPLADGLQFQSPQLRQAVEDGLIKLLPRMRASDAHYLDDTQRGLLNKQVGIGKANPRLVKAILMAWQQVGDQSALPYVEYLSKDASRDPEIRRAAEDCLPYLMQRAAEQTAMKTLLRAAGGGTVRPGELLRAASADAETHADTLLRADNTDRGRPDLGQYAACENLDPVESIHS